MGSSPADPPVVRLSALRIPLLALLLLLGRVPGSGAGEPDPDAALLLSTRWAASAYSHHTGGSVCWIQGPDGSLRVEVRLGPAGGARPAAGVLLDGPPLLAPLLTRTGEGWTLILGPAGTGTLNAWGRPWRHAPAGLAQMARLITAASGRTGDPGAGAGFRSLAGGHRPGALVRPRVLPPAPPAADRNKVWRYQLASLDPGIDADGGASGFRAGMTARGRGTGGAGEIVALRRYRVAGGEGFALAVTSSRRPGELRLDPARAMAVEPPVPEVFLPLWPLAEFYEPR